MDVIRALRPEVVIHAQALSDVDRCEQDQELTHAMNVRTTANIIEALRDTGALMVYVSTDYVFDGAKGIPYDETDEPRPLSVYGRSKVKSERLTLDYAHGIVVRPSTLFGPGRMNFCDSIVTRVKAGQSVEAFQDQVTSPTYTEDFAEGIGHVVRTLQRQGVSAAMPSRILHVANAGGCSRLELAQRVVDLLGSSREHIRPIRMAEQQRPAPRPAYSVLTSCYLFAMIGRTLRPWDDAVHAYLRARHWLN